MPGMVIPGVQPHFMMLRGLADDRFIFRADAPAGPCGSGQQDIPAVERCCARAQHFEQKGQTIDETLDFFLRTVELSEQAS